MLCIVDFGVGNILSVANMVKRIGAQAIVSSDPVDIKRADRLILPGVGAFDEGMRNLRSRGLIDVLTARVQQDGVPILGVCLGMQLLGRGSEEGVEPGLAWMPMTFQRFASTGGAQIKSLHMGWNVASPMQRSPLFADLGASPRFYFVHGYYATCDDPADVLARTTYGVEFASAIGRRNIFGVQFHPEKSHRFGMQLYKNFLELAPTC